MDPEGVGEARSQRGRCRTIALLIFVSPASLSLLSCTIWLGANLKGYSFDIADAVVQVIGHTPSLSVCGSGVVVSQDGYILTAGHVVEDATRIEVFLLGLGSYPASSVQRHPWLDLALLHVEFFPLFSLPLRVSMPPAEGEEVWLIGYEGCSESRRSVKTFVGQREENVRQGLVWYECVPPLGFSGGAVVDREGALVAVHFERPVDEGGGRGVLAEAALTLLPSDVRFALFLPVGRVIAQWAQVSETVTPGDVLEEDPSVPSFYRKAREEGPVAGVAVVYPAVAGGRAILAREGFALVKVTNQAGPISRGDLLVASKKAGYAQRGNGTEVLQGLVVGKALEDGGEGKEVILVLLIQDVREGER